MGTAGGTLSFADDTGVGEQGFAAPYLVRLLSAERPHAPSARISVAEVHLVRLGRGAELSHLRSTADGKPALDVTVPDGWMSTRHAEIERRGQSWILRDVGSKNGTFVGGERVRERELADGEVLETGNTFFLFRSRVERRIREPADLDAAALAGRDPALATLYPPLARELADLQRVAASPVPVLLLGPTGTGKELTARLIHQASGRAGAFVAVNGGALPANLVESELFGHKKGAFSGAVSDRVGLVQAADGGTLFLDEVAELPADTQVKLLRVLQEREVTPVGATRPVRVDLRVVSATHEDLPGRADDGRFRADLFARLAGHQVHLPALRERREDLGLLVAAVLRRLGAHDARFERDAARALCAYDWPRNIRELEQALSAAWALADDGRIALSHLPAAVTAPPRASTPRPPSDADEALRAELEAALRRHGGNVSAISRELGKARVQIRRWCKRFGLNPDDFRG